MKDRPKQDHQKKDLQKKARLEKRALILAYYFPPMGLSGVQRIAKLVKYLPANGWKVTVITPIPGAYFAFDETLLDELTTIPDVTIERTETWDPTRFRSSAKQSRIPFPEERSRKGFSKISQWLFWPDNKIGWKRFAVKKALASHKARPVDLVYATAPPYSCFLAGRSVSKKLGIPLVIDYRDDWIENPRHTYPTAWHKRKNVAMEAAVIASCSHVFTINEHIAQAVKLRNPAFAHNVSVVPHGFDPQDFPDNEKSYEPDQKPSATDKMTFLYAGMFYDAQQPDSFLKALQKVCIRQPRIAGRIRAQFAGLFPESKKERITECGLDTIVELKGYLSHVKTIQMLKLCDVAWMIIGRQQGEEGISTGKLFEYLGSRKPILGLVPNGTAKETLSGYAGGRTVMPDDVDTIADEIETLFNEWEEGRLTTKVEGNLAQFDRSEQATLIAEHFDRFIS